MKLFLISQTDNKGYDTYDSAVVAAPDEETARNMDPETGKTYTKLDYPKFLGYWCSGPELVSVKYLGEAVDIVQGVVCASFNAG